MRNTITMIVLVTLAMNVSATVWRVNNMPGVNASFTTIQAAHNANYVYAGDTIYLEASSGTYGNLTATKRLVIIGAGYFLVENSYQQANSNSSIIGTIILNAGSQGTIIEGCRINNLLISTSDIIIQRNQIINDDNSTPLIKFPSQNINNTLIRNNYLKHEHSYAGIGIFSEVSGINNVRIIGNYIETIDASDFALDLRIGFSGIIENNVISGNVKIYGTQFNNNILREGTFTPTNSTYYNNIGNATQFGTTNGNLQNINMITVFVGPTGYSTDGQWQLKTGSAAIGAGVGGVDCGMFGGAFPYILSGLPGIPSIYFHEQDIDNVNQQLNISIKAKSNN